MTSVLTSSGQNANDGGQISSDQLVCPGEMPDPLQSISPASGGGTTPIQYLWMTTNNLAMPINDWSEASGTNNQATYQPSAVGITTYFVRCARRQGFVQYVAESNIITISVGSSPTAKINNNPEEAYVGATLDFSADYAFNGTYSWDLNGDGVPECTGINCSFTYSIPGIYNIELTVDNGTCSIITTEQITILNPTVASINDPCSCDNPANYFDNLNYYVQDYIFIRSNPGEFWFISDITFQKIFNNAGVELPLGTEIPELVNAPGTYFLNIWFISGDGYAVESSNNVFTLSTGTTDPCNCFNPLPVELLNFEAEVIDEEVHLTWATASEKDNSHFEVERSIDGIRFDGYVGALAGQGNSTNYQSYTLKDNNTLAGETYYRLKQIDFDGTYTYSDIVSVIIESERPITAVIPNPVRDHAIVRFNQNLPPDADLELYSPAGTLINIYKINRSSLEINTQQLDRGIYFLKIKQISNNKYAFYKFVKI
ncbi:MAG: T9SS type A sorting domain-containing protein [Bacteroidota bacterium]